jgi:hypothetical protein
VSKAWDATRRSWARQPDPVRKWALPAGVIALGVLYPFYVDSCRWHQALGIAVDARVHDDGPGSTSSSAMQAS